MERELGEVLSPEAGCSHYHVNSRMHHHFDYEARRREQSRRENRARAEELLNQADEMHRKFLSERREIDDVLTRQYLNALNRTVVVDKNPSVVTKESSGLPLYCFEATSSNTYPAFIGRHDEYILQFQRLSANPNGKTFNN
jgi:hypothetical protein